MEIARVAVYSPVDKLFDYLVPEGMATTSGMRHKVPFGRGQRTVTGVVIEVYEETPENFSVDDTNQGKNSEPSKYEKMKHLGPALEQFPFFTTEMLELTKWTAEYYLSSWGEALRTASYSLKPPAMSSSRKNACKLYHLKPQVISGRLTGKQRKIVEFLSENGSANGETLKKSVDASRDILARLVKRGIVLEKELDPSEMVCEKAEKSLSSSDVSGNLMFSSSQRAAMEKHSLTDEQREALEKIVPKVNQRSAETFVLWGVTGSGKTEIYLKAIEAVVRKGLQAIVLVPEISLTPQTISRFEERFGDRISLLHSRMSNGERYRAYERLLTGESLIAIGTRSAIFAPCKNLGIIVLDEEGERTYVQEDHLRYHTRVVAVKRSELSSCPVIFGSATPSAESWSAADTDVYRGLRLKKRVFDTPLPEVITVDMREELKSGNRSMLSIPLQEALKETIASGSQALLLLNRRGYSTFVLCRECGLTVECPNCDIALKYHQSDDRIRCHYCHFSTRPPALCPSCGSKYIRYFGGGTQRLEEEVRRKLPGVRVARMDADTTSRKGSHEAILSSFERGEIQILVGTQMTAKGHDFPGLALVGIVSADSSLFLPDFRSAERTFSLIVQVAGRAGRRREQGRVFVQTYTPEAPAVSLAANHDVDSFMRLDLSARETLGYPPFSTLARAIFRGPFKDRVMDAADNFAEKLRAEVRSSLKINREFKVEKSGKGSDSKCSEGISNFSDETSNFKRWKAGNIKNTDVTMQILGPADDLKIRGLFAASVTLKAHDWSIGRPVFSKVIDGMRRKMPGKVTMSVEVDG